MRRIRDIKQIAGIIALVTWSISAAAHFTDTLILEEVHIVEKPTRTLRNEGSLLIEHLSNRHLQQHLGGSLMHSLQHLPGVQAFTIGSNQAKPMIRGLSMQQVVVIDHSLKHQGQEWGIDHGLEMDQYRVSSVEIIKGPASARYGSDAIGGALVLRSAEPSPPYSLQGSLDLAAKTNNAYGGGSIALSGRTGKWYAVSRVSLASFADTRIPTDTVHVYDYAVDLPHRQIRNTAGRESALFAGLGYQHGGTHAVLNGSIYHTESGFFANAHGLEPRQVDRLLHDRSRRDIQWPSQAVHHWKLNSFATFDQPELRLTASLGIQQNRRREQNRYTAHGDMPPVFPTHIGFPANLERFYDKTTLSGRVEGDVRRRHAQFSGGWSGEFQDNKISGWNFLSPAFRQYTTGFFVNTQLRLTANTSLSGALRYDYTKLHSDPYRNWFSTDEQFLLRAHHLRRQFHSPTWAIGVHHTRQDWVLVANLGTGFRVPLAKELAADGVNYHYFRYEKGDPSLDPERSVQLDIAGRWSRGNWSIQVDAFHGHFQNYVYMNPTSRFDYTQGAGNQVFLYTQAMGFRQGFETRLDWKIGRQWRAGLVTEYLRARQLSGDKKGYTLPLTPPPSATTSLQWNPALRSTLLQQLHLGFDVRLTGKQRAVVPPEKQTDGSQVIDLQIRTTWTVLNRSIDLDIRALNLLDTNYLNHLSFYRLIGMPEPGRNIVLQVRLPITDTNI